MPLKIPFIKSGKSKKPASARGGKAPAPAAKKQAGKPKPAATRKSGLPPPPAPPLINLSVDRQLDLVGIGLAGLGIVMGIIVFSGGQSGLGGLAINVLSYLFGWGAIMIAAALIIFGLWLIIRKIDRVPNVSAERVTGVILFTLLALALFQWWDFNPEPSTGLGGGWVGRIFYGVLDASLGEGGAFVVMFAWGLIAATMAFDLTVPEILALFKPITDKIYSAWRQWQANRRAAQSFNPTEPFDGEFTRINRTGVQETIADVPVSVPAIGVPTTTVGSNKPVAPQVNWVLPTVRDILESGNAPASNEEFVQQRARLIEETLASFGAPAQVVEINRGPTITQFGVEPLFLETRAGRTRVRVSKIASLADDLALALAAPRIRIQAPVPGHSYVGIEVPNDEMAMVALRDILESEVFIRTKKQLSFALGRDVSGHPISADLTSMPHMLIAGTTGSGKSVCVNAILTCLLLQNTPDDLRMILVDPKRVEMTGYNGIPHLLAPVVVEMDRVIGALQWMTREMDRRYHNFAQVGARNIQDYNARMKAQGQKNLPYLVVVIDELADLMMIAPDETERTITRLAQLARATGIHLILATQRPSVDVVTGLIKANFPARVAFAVSSNTDSRVILDQPGAERLLGRGDMLYQSPDAPAPARLQGVFVSDNEIRHLVDFWRAQGGDSQIMPGGPVDATPSGVPLKQTPLWEDMAPEEKTDVLMNDAIDIIRREGRASVSMLQRKLRIGYTRAARLVDTLEEKGIIGAPEDSTGVRRVLDYGPAAPPKEN